MIVWCLLVDVAKLDLDSETASRLLLEKGKIAATPMRNWGSQEAANYLRLAYSNEPVPRLRGIRERVRTAWNV